MTTNYTYVLLLLVMGLICSCSSGEKELEYEEYVFAAQLVDDPEMVEKYLDYHKNVWPEVEAAFEKAGYRQIRLYRFGNYITMTIKVPKGSDLDSMGQTSMESHPKVEEWQGIMDGFQKGLPGAGRLQKWVVLEKYYEFNNGR